MQTTGDWNGIKSSKGSDESGAFVGNNQSGNNQSGPSPYSAPTGVDKIQDSPVRYTREVRGRTMKYCSKCTRNKGSTRKGRWNTTHFSDEHKGPVQGDSDSNKKDSANAAVTDSSTTSVSFEDSLREASE